MRHADIDDRKLVVDAETPPLRRKVMSAMPLEFGAHEKTTGVVNEGRNFRRYRFFWRDRRPRRPSRYLRLYKGSSVTKA